MSLRASLCFFISSLSLLHLLLYFFFSDYFHFICEIFSFLVFFTWFTRFVVFSPPPPPPSDAAMFVSRVPSSPAENLRLIFTHSAPMNAGAPRHHMTCDTGCQEAVRTLPW